MANSIAAFASKFFLDREKVIKRFNRAERKALIRSGALTRKIAQRSIRKPRMGVPDFIKTRHRKAVQRARKRKEKVDFPSPAKRPMPAKPGEPPRDKTGTLKRTIFFGLNPEGHGVTTGAIPFGANTVSRLEHGGKARLRGFRGRQMTMQFRGNPFMKPALEKAAPQVGNFFKNIL